MTSELLDRRTLLVLGSTATAAAMVSACGGGRDASRTAHDEKHGSEKGEEEDVSPAEDLMREHGVLNRVLLVYEECIRRAELPSEPVPVQPLGAAAGIIRRFIEEYHEKLEEDFLFPRFEKAGKLVELVTVLRQQHIAGRKVTAEITRLAGAGATQSPEARHQLVKELRSFIRMYRPHEAREGTVLFPALPTVIGHKELEELGEQFEEKEHKLFGKEGFEGVVVQIAGIEQQLGIAELAQFTP